MRTHIHNNTQTRLQVCNHPYLFNIDAEPHFDGVTTGEDIVEASGKMQVSKRLLVCQKAKKQRLMAKCSRAKGCSYAMRVETEKALVLM